MYCTGRYGQYFLFQWVKQYRNTFKSYRSKYQSIPEYTRRTGECRPFWLENKNRSVKKKPLKWMEKKWRTKVTGEWPMLLLPPPLRRSLLSCLWSSPHLPLVSFVGFTSSSSSLLFCPLIEPIANLFIFFYFVRFSEHSHLISYMP